MIHFIIVDLVAYIFLLIALFRLSDTVDTLKKRLDAVDKRIGYDWEYIKDNTHDINRLNGLYEELNNNYEKHFHFEHEHPDEIGYSGSAIKEMYEFCQQLGMVTEDDGK